MTWLERLFLKEEFNSILGRLSKMSHLKSWWLAHAAWIGVVVTFLSPSLENYEATHKGTVSAFIIGLVLARLVQKGLTKPIAMIAIAFLAFSLPVSAQTTTPTTKLFSVASQASSLSANGQTVIANITEPTVSVTDKLDLKFVTVQAPAVNFAYYGGGFNYTFPSFGQKINNASPTINGLRLEISLTGSVGIDRISHGSTTEQHYAYMVGGRAYYSLTSSGNYQLGGGVEYGHFTGLQSNTKLFYFGPKITF